jgi:hypothetical protein
MVIAQYESGNQNVLNASGPSGTPASSASGYFQMTNGTWQQALQLAGMGSLASTYPTAMSAPYSVQYQAAEALYDQQGITPWQSNAKLMAALSNQSAPSGSGVPSSLPSTPAVRGRVVMAMTRDELNVMAASNNFVWNIVDGQVVGLAKYTFLTGDAIVINSSTGMVGVPEQTEEGITVTTLLNPQIRWGTLVQIDETAIARYTQTSAFRGGAAISPDAFEMYQKGGWLPPYNADGYYVVLQVRHFGDTRGTEWYSNLICLSIDKTALLPRATPQEIIPAPIA